MLLESLYIARTRIIGIVCTILLILINWTFLFYSQLDYLLFAIVYVQDFHYCL